MDIGGTFTDVVAVDDETGVVTVAKAATTPKDLTDGILSGIASLVENFADIAFTVHGTTQGLNAVLERRGARVLLLTTEGFTDVYHIARATRRDLFNVHYHKREPMLRLRDIFGIPERVDHRGAVVRGLDLEAVREAAKRARAEGYDSIAISFLFGYLNPVHEREARDEILREWPEAVVSISSDVAPEWREYERTSSVVMDAYISPVMRSYLAHFEERMRDEGIAAPLNVMQSNGGIMSSRRASEQSLQTLLSGPVGGTISGETIAGALGRSGMICVDMGGTSFDVSLVVDGKAQIAAEAAIEGMPMLIPVVDVHTVGAGGGSIARVVSGGLRVGPESAGSMPGPVCYGRGGTEPTVTDANVVLGRVLPEGFASGTVSLDVEAAFDAMTRLGKELSLDPYSLAEGICQVANASMGNAIRRITVERGIEPREYTLVAFGGAGPMHAVFLAQELEIPEVVIPPFPGVLSAWGMLHAKYRADRVSPLFSAVERLDPAEFSSVVQSVSDEARAALSAEGRDASGLEVAVSVDARYVGQEFTTPVGYDPAESAEHFIARLTAAFHEAHRAQFGHANERAEIEITSVRAVATAPLAGTSESSVTSSEHGPREVRTVVFGGKPVQTPVYERASLPNGLRVDGPLIIKEETATSVIPPGCSVDVHESGSLVVHVGKGGE